jgi:two-component sensor histidine kinase
MSADNTGRVAKVRVQGTRNLVTVPITSQTKPAIPEDFEHKWQEIVTLAARLIGVPAGLIMRLHESDIEVYSSSGTDDNPYSPAAREDLGLGLYCETVVGKRTELLVPHALEDPAWKDNPDVALSMYSYLGVPVRWPDGEVFGTFCVLDSKRNEYGDDQRQLIRRLAELVENDLRNLVDMSDRLAQAELKEKEIRHRIKNQFNLLISYIDLHSQHGSQSQEPDSVVNMIRRRIDTLAKTHQRMSVLAPGSKPSLLRYLHDVVPLLVSSAPVEINVDIDGDEVFLDEEKLVPIASIINELVTNSIKHAFGEVAEPTVMIRVHRDTEQACIDYGDNGSASGEGTEEGPGLGRLIIEGLVAQLSATLEQDGFDYRICIPIREVGGED